MTEVTQAPAMVFTDFVVPPQVVTKIDMAKLVREMERVDADLTAAEVRVKSNTASPAMAPLSQPLMDFLVQNKFKVDDARVRLDIIRQMRLLKDKAPVIHMTFAVTADTESLQQLVLWMRTSIHPQILISVGLQPALVAGVYLRTPNHVRDLSIRGKLEASRGLLLKEVESLRG